MKKVLIFGSTGSVGRNALNLLKGDKGKFKVIGLCANRDISTLSRQIKEFDPAYVCVRDEVQAKKMQPTLGRAKLFKGEKGLEEFSTLRSDISLMAISGISCLKPLLINTEYTRRVALANKESLVTAGPLVFNRARKFNTEILSVDSEINALFQLLEVDPLSRKSANNLRKVYLTASGGSLAGYRRKDLANVGVKEVLAHPNWKMGRRITVDSSTLVNKGFEVIEAHYFFGLPYEKIDIVIHKESFIHALVEYEDNTLLACLYAPDMKKPISFAFSYPRRFNFNRKVNFKHRFSYTFSPVVYKDYPLLKIVLEAAKRKDNSLVILNACDEIAVDRFLRGKIKFTTIHKALEYIFKHYPRHKVKSVNDVFFWDDWSRVKTREYLGES